MACVSFPAAISSKKLKEMKNQAQHNACQPEVPIIIAEVKEVLQMYGSSPTYYSLWWIVPVIMMVICILMMRGRRGSMMCGFGHGSNDKHQSRSSESAMEILDRRYASGEIDKDEYEQKKRTLTGSTDFRNE
jgi:putative membrane protein